jgi:UDP-N-acetylmuramoyl-L-alanyl-D-glutamate--2,6-diaminopimelate ligase
MSNLESLFIKYNIPKPLSEKIGEAHWKTQDSKEDDILFYKFNNPDCEKEQNLFSERLKDSKFKLCIVNNHHIKFDRVYSVGKNFNDFQQECLDILYPFKEGVQFFGVTGTNGKTTTVDLIRQLLILHNKKVMTIGTLGVYINKTKEDDFSLTTPALIDLYKAVFKFKDRVDYIFMEMSSHALIQKRFGKIQFQKIGWTNFTQDHLDYHKTMDEYFEAKALIRNYVKKDFEIVVPEGQVNVLNQLKFKPTKAKNQNGIENSFFKPIYNLENLAIATELIKDIVIVHDKDIESLTPPPGRFNIIDFNSTYIIVDFAHTPDAIHSIGKEIKNSFPGKKLKTVLGCGGDRDKTKRKPMGEAASQFSSYIYITSDNPRFEDPLEIINDIIPGVTSPYEVEADRKLTIRNAMSHLSHNEILLIVGKGHEAYLDIKGIKHPYSDIETVQEYKNDKS